MKNKAILVLALLFGMFAFTGCTEGDGEKDYGYAYIYMPQATVDGGLTNQYPVPSGGGEYSYNFKVENGKLNIILGVLRAGKFEKNESFSVSVAADETKTQAAITNGSVSNAVAMPSTIYTLPTEVTVPSGKSSEAFYLAVDVASIKGTTEYSGKKLILEVGISNPTRYELASTNTSVLVVLDVDAIQQYL